ncbi:MAG: VCBS repeat-containing protein, partial [Gemmatimonadetes bacterium]|nr:VCBS repeat-containing protein [Gemmatimonadota bacterium]
DAIIGTWQDALRLHTNVADDGSIGLSLTDTAFVTLTRGRNAAPALGDIDADGDLDLFVGESSGALNFYENTGGAGAPEFTLVSDEYGDFDVGRRSFPVLHDLDADGDLDLLVGSESSGIHIFRNQGTPTTPEFVEDGLFEVDHFGFAAPALADLDGDGDDDMLLGGGRGGLWFFENRR